MTLLLEIVRVVVPWVIPIAGWWIVSKGNDRRETRKEVRSLCNEIRLRILALSKSAKSYHVSSPDSEPAGCSAHDVRGELNYLGLQLKTLHGFGGGFDDLDSHFVQYRQAVTGGMFDSGVREPVSPGHDVINNIQVAELALLYYVESAFQRQYVGSRHVQRWLFSKQSGGDRKRLT